VGSEGSAETEMDLHFVDHEDCPMKNLPDIPKLVGSFIRRKDLFEPREQILAAVSGGADSLCLLLVLKALGYSLRVAHFDHHLRPESGRDAETVHRMADRLGLPFVLGQGDVAAHAALLRMTLEEAARDLRYKFLARVASDQECSAIATGHTMDDQAETLLMRLIRGTGTRGLGGIRPTRKQTADPADPDRRSIRIVRPLLCLTHAQTGGYCVTEGWTPIEDPTNQVAAVTRNRIRLELIPLLRTYNPSIVDGLSRLAEVAQAQDEFLEQTAGEIWDRQSVELAPGLIRLPLDIFRSEAAAVRLALFRQAVFHLTGGLEDLSYRQVERVLDLIQTSSARQRTDLALGVEVQIENGWLVFKKPASIPDRAEWEDLQLPCPGKISIHHPRWSFELVMMDALGLPEPDTRGDCWTSRIDPDRIHPPLFIRKRRRGEKFFPLGMAGPVSLDNFLASHHVPLSERDHWPLVCDQEEIIWIPGYRIRNGINPTENSHQILRVQVDRKG
jgi:tRNA(Ile)-lysidine synthase